MIKEQELTFCGRHHLKKSVQRKRSGKVRKIGQSNISNEREKKGELADLMERRKMSILRLQDTKKEGK